MNKQELSAIVAEILASMGKEQSLSEPEVKGSSYYPRDPGPQQKDAGSLG